KPVRHLGAEKEPEPVLQTGRCRNLINVLAVVPERQMQGRLRQRQARKGFGDVADFRRGGLEEFAAHRGVIKEMLYFKARAGRTVPGADCCYGAAVAGDL